MSKISIMNKIISILDFIRTFWMKLIRHCTNQSPAQKSDSTAFRKNGWEI